MTMTDPFPLFLLASIAPRPPNFFLFGGRSDGEEARFARRAAVTNTLLEP